MEISSDENDYETVLETTLEDRRQEECLAPLEQHDVKKTGRYIKVTLVDFYELGSGLHYFNVVHKTPDEVSTQ